MAATLCTQTPLIPRMSLLIPHMWEYWLGWGKQKQKNPQNSTLTLLLPRKMGEFRMKTIWMQRITAKGERKGISPDQVRPRTAGKRKRPLKPSPVQRSKDGGSWLHQNSKADRWIVIQRWSYKAIPGCGSMWHFGVPSTSLVTLSVRAALKSVTQAKDQVWKAKITSTHWVKPQPKAALEALWSLLHVLHLSQSQILTPAWGQVPLLFYVSERTSQWASKTHFTLSITISTC